MLDGELVILGERRQAGLRRPPDAPPPGGVAGRAGWPRRCPATFVAFDLLAHDDESLLDAPFRSAGRALEKLGREADRRSRPARRTATKARQWLKGAEGVVAKELDAPYRPGERIGMVKIKRVRTIDSVVVGWRPGKEEGTVGSLILGLYDDGGELQVVGPHLRLPRQAEARAARDARALRDRRARLGRAEPLERRPRPGMGGRCGRSSSAR